MRLRSLAITSALAVAVAPLMTSSALSADTTVGDALIPTNVPSCNGVTFVLPAATAPNYVVPSNGIITSWRTSTIAGSSAATRTLKVARANSNATSYTVVATSTPLALPASSAAQTLSQSVRIAATTGDVLGFSSAGTDPCGTQTNNTADQYVTATGDAPVGTVLASNSGGTGYRFSVAATLEADADGDGYGDTTQDACPTDATTQGACKVAAPDPKIAPDINFGRADDGVIKRPKPGKKAKKTAKITVAFAGNSVTTHYTCAVDGGAPVACTSPFTPRLKKGRHTVTITAYDAAGNPDPTPPIASVKVIKAKKKR